jgi:hypothetical protein
MVEDVDGSPDYQRLSTRTVSDDEILEVFKSADEQYLSTADVAEELPIGKRAVHPRLDDLKEVGRLEKRSIGAGSTWWVPENSMAHEDIVDTIAELQTIINQSSDPWWSLVSLTVDRTESRIEQGMFLAVLAMPLSVLLLAAFVVGKLLERWFEFVAPLSLVLLAVGLLTGGIATVVFVLAGSVKLLQDGWILSRIGIEN